MLTVAIIAFLSTLCSLENGVIEMWFLRLKPGDKHLNGVSEDTVELLEELQDTLKKLKL